MLGDAINKVIIIHYNLNELRTVQSAAEQTVEAAKGERT